LFHKGFVKTRVAEACNEMTNNAGSCNEKDPYRINGLPTLAAPLNPSCRAFSGKISFLTATRRPFRYNPAK
jgi:hypothetical protein